VSVSALMSFSTAAWVGAVLNAVLVVAVFVRRVRRSSSGQIRFGMVDLVVPAAAGVGGVLLVFVALTVLYDLGDLGVVSVVYLQLVLAVPLVAAAVLTMRWWPAGLQTRATTSGPVTALLGASLLLAPVGIYATHIEPFRLQTHEVTVALPTDRVGSDRVTIGVLADIQAGVLLDHHFDAVDRVMAAEPDIVLVAGDIYQGDDNDGFEDQLPRFRELLARLHAPGGVYVVFGDTDYGNWLARLTYGLDAEVIEDRVVEVTVGDRQVAIGGLPLRPELGSSVPDALVGLPDDVITVMLAHRPDWVLGLEPQAGIDLVVAGHTHGGQVRLPVLGPIVTRSSVPRSVAAGGLHEIEGNPIYVSPGVGWANGGAPRVRFLAPPAVAILTLE
jgi:predicted MPP superfamily phosphohydrolase